MKIKNGWKVGESHEYPDEIYGYFAIVSRPNMKDTLPHIYVVVGDSATEKDIAKASKLARKIARLLN